MKKFIKPTMMSVVLLSLLASLGVEPVEVSAVENGMVLETEQAPRVHRSTTKHTQEDGSYHKWDVSAIGWHQIEKGSPAPDWLALIEASALLEVNTVEILESGLKTSHIEKTEDAAVAVVNDSAVDYDKAGAYRLQVAFWHKGKNVISMGFPIYVVDGKLPDEIVLSPNENTISAIENAVIDYEYLGDMIISNVNGNTQGVSHFEDIDYVSLLNASTFDRYIVKADSSLVNPFVKGTYPITFTKHDIDGSVLDTLETTIEVRTPLTTEEEVPAPEVEIPTPEVPETPVTPVETPTVEPELEETVEVPTPEVEVPEVEPEVEVPEVEPEVEVPVEVPEVEQVVAPELEEADEVPTPEVPVVEPEVEIPVEEVLEKEDVVLPENEATNTVTDALLQPEVEEKVEVTTLNVPTELQATSIEPSATTTIVGAFTTLIGGLGLVTNKFRKRK